MSDDSQAPNIPGKGIPQSKTSALAIVSLVLGIASLICSILTGVPAIILGIIAYIKTSNSDGRVKGEGLAIGGIVTGAIGCLLSVALLILGVTAARSAARQTTTLNDVRQIGLACLKYENANQRFPSNISRENREGGLSWRVHILPFLGEAESQIHAQFHLDEPWDSPHNITLLPLIPQAYQHIQLQADLPEGHTVFQMPMSAPDDEFPAVLIEGEPGIRYVDIRDGSSNTILVIETDAQSAVPWTQPVDWRFDPNNPKRNFGDTFACGTTFGRCDGSVFVLDTETIPDEAVRSLFTHSGGEIPFR